MELGEEEEEEERGGGGSKGSPEEPSAMEDRCVMGGVAWLPGAGGEQDWVGLLCQVSRLAVCRPLPGFQ